MPKTQLDPTTIYAGHPEPKPFHMAGSATGVLLLHGYTGSPPEMLPVAHYLHDRGGYTVSGPLLPGHGTRPEDMRRIRWRQWANAVNYAYINLAAQCERIFIAGLSMGGVLALFQAAQLANDVPNKLAGVLSLSTPMYINDWRVPLAPLAKHIIRWQGKATTMREKVSIHNKDAATELWAYLRSPSHAAHQVLVLIRQTRRRLRDVTVPILIMHSRHDTTAPPPSAQIIYDHVGATDKQLIWLDNSNHVITVDYDRPLVLQAVYDFISSHLINRSTRTPSRCLIPLSSSASI